MTMSAIPQFMLDKALLNHWRPALQLVGLRIEPIGDEKVTPEGVEHAWRCFDATGDLFQCATCIPSKEKALRLPPGEIYLVTGPRLRKETSSAYLRFEHILIASGARRVNAASEFEMYFEASVLPRIILDGSPLGSIGIIMEDDDASSPTDYPCGVLRKGKANVSFGSGPIISSSGKEHVYFLMIYSLRPLHPDDVSGVRELAGCVEAALVARGAKVITDLG
jgi:hypothetical protein